MGNIGQHQLPVLVVFRDLAFRLDPLCHIPEHAFYGNDSATCLFSGHKTLEVQDLAIFRFHCNDTVLKAVIRVSKQLFHQLAIILQCDLYMKFAVVVKILRRVPQQRFCRRTYQRKPRIRNKHIIKDDILRCFRKLRKVVFFQRFLVTHLQTIKNRKAYILHHQKKHPCTEPQDHLRGVFIAVNKEIIKR